MITRPIALSVNFLIGIVEFLRGDLVADPQKLKMSEKYRKMSANYRPRETRGINRARTFLFGLVRMIDLSRFGLSQAWNPVIVLRT